MKKKRFGVIGIALAILFLLGAAPSVLAAGLPSVAIPVKVEVEGAAQSVPEEFVVQMEAEDPSYPMPEGSVDGIFEMVISGNSFMSFPSMSYTEPGIYTYTIEQIAGLNPFCAYFPSVYHLIASVSNAGRFRTDGDGCAPFGGCRRKPGGGNVYKPIRHIARSTRFQPAQDW